MTRIARIPQQLDETTLQQQKPLTRGQVLARLEQVWEACEPHITGDIDRPDARMVDIGVKVLDRIARLYRIYETDTALAVDEEPHVLAARTRLAVGAQLAERAKALGGQ